MFSFKQLSKSYYSVQRHSQLVAHVQQEGVLQLLLFLGFGCFFLQSHFSVGHLCFVSAQAKIVGNLSFLICDWHHAEGKIDVAPIVISEFGVQRL